MDASHRTPALYRISDIASGILLLMMTVFAPWAFGCTVPWAVWTLCGAGYALGLLLLTKWIVRWREDYQPERWVTHDGPSRWVVRAFATLSAVLLGYILVSAVNGRSNVVFTKGNPIMVYRDLIPLNWLPSSYDANRSFRFFVRYVGLALAFWAARDWLITKTRRERYDAEEGVFPTARLRQLLWTLTISSALLGLVSIAQRLDGTDRILWMIERTRGIPGSYSWGAYPYRTNGAQYFNLIWPVVLGFWWALRQRENQTRKTDAKLGSDSHVVLLPFTILLAACPLLSTSRGGALIMVGILGPILVILLTSKGPGRASGRWITGGMVLATLSLGWFLGGQELQRRFQTVFSDRLSNRLDLYEVGERMVADAGAWGTGAESLAALYGLYRTRTDMPFESYLHNDWLETRITFGWVGLGLIVALLILLILTWATGQGIRAPREFNLFLGLSLVGALIHARFDFPFQIISIVFTFLILGATGLCSAPREASRSTRRDARANKGSTES